MASERQIAANRSNAARSGGPRSQAGKRRASRNSIRHGLSRPATLGYSDQKWVERFVRAATKGHRTLVTVELSRSAAWAHLDLLRVRQTRAAGVKVLNADLERWQSAASSKMDPKRNEIRLALLRLNRIDRYEQRAAWRRNKALRAIWELARDQGELP
jgi:hypothetical protein